MSILLWFACNGFTPDDTSEPTDSGVIDTGPAFTEHCGKLTEDQTWGAGLHRVTCDVEVNAGTLTIEQGATVEFKKGKGILVAQDEQAATLNIYGATLTPDPSEAGTSWRGIAFSKFATGSLTDTTLVDAGNSSKGAIVINGAEVSLIRVPVDGSRTDGLHLREGGRLAEGSGELTVTGAEATAVVVDATAAHTIPSGSYEGNEVDRIWVRADDVSDEVTWSNVGVPWVIDGLLRFMGTAEQPAGFTVEAGVVLEMNNGSGLTIGAEGGSAYVDMNGEGADPIRIQGYGSTEPGYWGSFILRPATTSAHLDYVVVEDGGRSDAMFVVDDTQALVTGLQLLDSGNGGFALEEGGRFAEGSTTLLVSNSAHAGSLPPDAITSLPADTTLGDLGENIVIVKGGTRVESSGTWPNLGAAYRIDVVVKVDGTADDPTEIRIEPGVELLFKNDKGLYFSQQGGASRLIAQGTVDQPIILRGYSSAEPGAFYGLGFFDGALASTLDHVYIDGAGGNKLDGNLHIEKTSVDIGTMVLSNSNQWGAYVKVPVADLPSFDAVTFSGNADGPWIHVEP